MEYIDFVRMCEGEDREEQMTVSKTKEQKQCKGQIYKVEAGDTLYNISRKYGLKVKDILKANPFVNVYNLQIGEEICIPVAQSMEHEKYIPYVVRWEDTLASILNQTGLTFEEMTKINPGLKHLTIPAGTVILVPNKKEDEQKMMEQKNSHGIDA